jgi:hypothetical protein
MKALARATDADIGAAGVQVPVAGSYNSAESNVFTSEKPPSTSTLPEARRVAVWESRSV